MLLTREQFRTKVFERDNYICVMCSNPAQDAHHILERRLFQDGGYYLDNGASVCGDCHLKAEKTEISAQELREKIGIKKPILPEHLYQDQEYDKWGNIILPNGQRLKGDLFFDESVQKVLPLHLFTHYIKYPRTFHLPWSPGMHSDDRVLKSTNQFDDIVVTKKMDGENFTMYHDYCHARSIDSRNHPSRNRAKAFHAQIQGNIPKDWRVCAENLYAKHSIFYNDLEAYVLAFSVWNEKNICLSWEDTKEWLNLLDIPMVPILYEGKYSEKLLHQFENDLDEGYVIRATHSFSYQDFKTYVAKYVRKDHIKTTKHWMRGQVLIENKLV